MTPSDEDEDGEACVSKEEISAEDAAQVRGWLMHSISTTTTRKETMRAIADLISVYDQNMSHVCVCVCICMCM